MDLKNYIVWCSRTKAKALGSAKAQISGSVGRREAPKSLDRHIAAYVTCFPWRWNLNGFQLCNLHKIIIDENYIFLLSLSRLKFTYENGNDTKQIQNFRKKDICFTKNCASTEATLICIYIKHWQRNQFDLIAKQ